MRHKRLLPSALAVILASCGLLWAQNPQRSHDSAVARNLTTFNALVKELELNYVDSIRTDEAFDMAIQGLLLTVDPYTEYFSSEDTEQLETITTGEYGGIGSYITEKDGWTYISEPYIGSPAAEAGLRAGDKILQIDSIDLKGIESGQVSKLLKGLPGTSVKVKVERPFAADSILVFDIERRKLVMPTVSWSGMYNDSIAYIELTSFNDKSPEEVRVALEKLLANPKLKGLVLDLRGNGGGVLNSAVDIVGLFVPKGTEVLKTRGRDKSTEKTYKTTRTPLAPDLPLAVLIDGGSASSSEITAGALQDLDRAVLVGSRSYGKGLVQGARTLPYDGLLKVTIAKYYIPSGRLIQALDYSHRNPDGSVARTPDSLTNVFKTRAGREVRDGGGLTPDSTVTRPATSRLVYNLVRGSAIFDYATRFAAEHPSVPSPKDFTITDEIFEDFKANVDPDQVKYDKGGEKLIKTLRTMLEEEGFKSDEITAQVDSLAALLDHDLATDLEAQRSDIETYLGGEIMTRYYYSPGQTEYLLKHDPEMEVAASILSNPALYRSILGMKE